MMGFALSFRLRLLAILSLLATPVPAVSITNTNFNVRAGQPFLLSWTGASSAVNITLKSGPSTSLADLLNLAINYLGTSYTWDVPANLASSTFVFSIIDSTTVPNFSPLFQVAAAAGDTSGVSSPETSSVNSLSNPGPSNVVPSTTSSTTLPNSPISSSTRTITLPNSTTTLSTSSITSSISSTHALDIPGAADASGGSGGLETGSKVGIGVGGSVAAIGLFIGGVFLYRWKRKAAANQSNIAELGQDPTELGGKSLSEMATLSNVPELVAEQPAQLAELSAEPVEPSYYSAQFQGYGKMQ